MDLYLAVFLGAIVYGLIDVVSGKHKEVFSWKYVAIIGVNVLCGIVLVWALNLNKINLTVNNFDWARLIGLAFGMSGQKFFKAIMRTVDKYIMARIKTKQPKEQ